MGRFVVVAYKPKPGKDLELLAAVKKHWSVLQSEQLVSNRQPYAMRASDGTIVEVFEWRSAEAIHQAHSNPSILPGAPRPVVPCKIDNRLSRSVGSESTPWSNL